jgi:methanogenic corrinoid protein MtbC1
MTPTHKDEQRRTLIAHISDLREIDVLNLVQKRLANGENPLAIIEDCQEGLQQVGERYEKQEYFLSGLISTLSISGVFLTIGK